MPLFGDFFHITKTNICWNLYPLCSWVMWNITGHRNQPLFNTNAKFNLACVSLVKCSVKLRRGKVWVHTQHTYTPPSQWVGEFTQLELNELYCFLLVNAFRTHVLLGVSHQVSRTLLRYLLDAFGRCSDIKYPPPYLQLPKFCRRLQPGNPPIFFDIW